MYKAYKLFNKTGNYYTGQNLYTTLSAVKGARTHAEKKSRWGKDSSDVFEIHEYELTPTGKVL